MSTRKFSASMFDKLKTTMAEQRSSGSFKDIIRTTIGNNYKVRLVPNLDDISKTIYHYFHHGFKSLATGQYVSCVCPTTFGERCPICEERVRLWRGDEEDKANAKLLGRKEQWITNIYVVEDPTNSENNGTLKMFRYGKQIDKIITDAMEGIDRDEFGAKIFDLSEDGCNLRISVEKNDGGYPSYTSSKFLRESKIEGLTDEKLESVYDKLFDLEKVFERKSTAEVGEMLDTHFFCQVSSTPSLPQRPVVETAGTEVTESKTVKDDTPVEENTESAESADNSVQDRLNDLLSDL